MKLTCAALLAKITGNQPQLTMDGRLDQALKDSDLDGPVTLAVIAYKESRYDTEASNGTSTATGLFQFLNGTADDIQDRVVKNFLPTGTKIPNVPATKRFADYRTDADASSFCAWAYLLDRIAANGNKLKEGISAFGTGNQAYGKSILEGVAAIRKVAGLPTDKPTDLPTLTKTMADKCVEVKAALNKVFGF